MTSKAERHKKAPKDVDASIAKSMSVLRKRTAAIQDEFEAEERQKREAREHQIKMLEATKKKIE